LDDQLKDLCLAGHDAPAAAIRVGSGWLEIKWIPRKGGKATGPYLYYRVREGGHLRSRYVGKATAGQPCSGSLKNYVGSTKCILLAWSCSLRKAST
jgi:hypothetical protein